MACNLKLADSLLLLSEIADSSWVPFWVNYQQLMNMIRKLPEYNAFYYRSQTIREEAIEAFNIVFGTSNEQGHSGGGSGADHPTSVEKKSNPHFHQYLDALLSYPAEVSFFQILHFELRKASRFYNHTKDEVAIRLDRLKVGAALMQRAACIPVDDKWSILARSAFKVYKDLLLLNAYCKVTVCAISEVLKRHDRVTRRTTHDAFMSSLVAKANLNDASIVQDMINVCSKVYVEATTQATLLGKSDGREDAQSFFKLIKELNDSLAAETVYERARLSKLGVVGIFLNDENVATVPMANEATATGRKRKRDEASCDISVSQNNPQYIERISATNL